MSPPFPYAGAWLGTLVDLAGCCVCIAAGLWIAESLTTSIWIHVVVVVAAMWAWDWFYAILQDMAGDSLERRSR